MSAGEYASINNELASPLKLLSGFTGSMEIQEADGDFNNQYSD